MASGTYPLPQPDDRLPNRVGWRHPVTIDAKVTSTRLGARKTEISDLSRAGCCVQLPKKLPLNDVVAVTIPTLAPLSARVVWSDGICSGLEFAQPLADAVMRMIVERYPRDGFISV